MEIKQEVPVCIKITPRQLAECFCDADLEEQAMFFNVVGELSEEWRISFCFQLQSIIDTNILTGIGKKVMSSIGEYGYES